MAAVKDMIPMDRMDPKVVVVVIVAVLGKNASLLLCQNLSSVLSLAKVYKYTAQQAATIADLDNDRWRNCKNASGAVWCSHQSRSKCASR